MDSSIDFSKLQELVDNMYKGDIDSIKIGLEHSGVLIRINAILSIAENELKNEELIEKVKLLKNDTETMDGISVGEYASGLLDVYGIEKYNGNSSFIKNLIMDGMKLGDDIE